LSLQIPGMYIAPSTPVIMPRSVRIIYEIEIPMLASVRHHAHRSGYEQEYFDSRGVGSGGVDKDLRT